MIALNPAGRDDVVNVALPPLSCTVPKTVVPAVNVTGPLGKTVGEVIFAVNVTACPTVDGFTDDVIVAAVFVCSTV